MKFSIMLLLPAALSATAQLVEVRATACGAGNNCQRGVGGTAGVKPPLSSRLADCSSLYTVTVTPATYTTTTTTSVPDLPTLKKRTATITPASSAVTVSPTSVPSYATYCSSASAYYSACSCAGITGTTTTAPTPTYTSTVTATITCAAERKIKRGIALSLSIIKVDREKGGISKETAIVNRR
ncbi:hypothetical protein L207DRAFT_609174 [Hyaloscypha variabilis F]|uniref:Uncharacterized protein n=1 Tax=Hyaloscypha variabilis (strain UAMH 11265 / GT02V1 / F) TaxID=1149755 RepID=A0A2J6R236_HYAVF|nr:hypothetical protein L207DRAFT_609174 [Hyaloscypha variabilis F]